LKFNRNHSFKYCVAEKVAPGLRRITAQNPGPFTFHGTGTYIVGQQELSIIDPGPDLRTHLNALSESVNNHPVQNILLTHRHEDHAGLASACASQFNATIWAGDAPKALPLHNLGDSPTVRLKQKYRKLNDNSNIEIDNYHLIAMHTPGHTSDHFCFRDDTHGRIFCGDHIMGWSTTVVLPPDGNMGQYIRSLQSLRAFDDYTFWPTHGSPITNPREWILSLLEHRAMREEQLMRTLGEEPASATNLIEQLYPELPLELWPAAGQSILAGAIFLVEKNMAECADITKADKNTVFFRLY
jgi:glyoxylase-like metal-dependent hydrolase (beta-lactamase superfamily II)